ncbi:MAG TPA: tRNA epoxyqueuosine(34) reductase QueG, partial [Enterovirga sp.]
MPDLGALKGAIVERARLLGFDLVRVTNPDAIPEAGARLDAWLNEGHHGTMEWMAATPERRREPRGLWSQVRSIVVVGISYAPPYDPL